MRYWFPTSQRELFPSAYECEFSALRIDPIRRRTMNYEVVAEPNVDGLQSPNDSGDVVAERGDE